MSEYSTDKTEKITMTNFIYSDLNELIENYPMPTWRKNAIRRFMHRHKDWANQLVTDPSKFFAAIMKFDFLEQPIGNGRHILQVSWHHGLYSKELSYLSTQKVNVEAKRTSALLHLFLLAMGMSEEIGLHQRLGFFDAKPKQQALTEEE